MQIGIVSDSHDRIEETHKAMHLLSSEGCEVLVHCGDFCAPFMMDVLADFNGEIHCVFGNIDDKFITPKKAAALGINFHGDIAELEFDGKKIAVNHFPQVADGLALTGRYDLVLYGHDHIADKKKLGDTWLANPGELMGRKGKRTCAVYDTSADEIKHIDVD